MTPSASDRKCRALLAFYGDDFTGASENMAQYHRHGLRTFMFLERPNPDLFARKAAVFEVVSEIADQKLGYVPHYPFGTKQDGFARRHGLPFETTQGGKDSIYPEYETKIRQLLGQAGAVVSTASAR